MELVLIIFLLFLLFTSLGFHIRSSNRIFELELDIGTKELTILSWQQLANKYYRLHLNAQQKIKLEKTQGTHWRTILGFSKQQVLTKEQITSRYRNLAKIYHPDLNSGQQYAMTLLNLAKEKADKEFS